MVFVAYTGNRIPAVGDLVTDAGMVVQLQQADGWPAVEEVARRR